MDIDIIKAFLEREKWTPTKLEGKPIESQIWLSVRCDASDGTIDAYVLDTIVKRYNGY